MDKCKVIALVNQKDGVAKTTSIVNLGVGLVTRKKLLFRESVGKSRVSGV